MKSKLRLRSQENIQTIKSNIFETSKSFLQNMDEVKSIVEKWNKHMKKNKTATSSKGIKDINKL